MYRFPSLKHSNWLFFHEQYDGVTGKMFWWLTKKIIFWLWAGWVASYLQRSLSAQVNGGPDATPNLWKQLFSAVRASGGYPGNDAFKVKFDLQGLGKRSPPWGKRKQSIINALHSCPYVPRSHQSGPVGSTHRGPIWQGKCDEISASWTRQDYSHGSQNAIW